MYRKEPDRIQKIMIRTPNWIGDAVMTTPAMAVVRDSFPGARIVLVANPVVSQLFSPHPSCDDVIVYDKKGIHKGLAGLVRFSFSLRRESFDLAILFQNAIEAAIIGALAGIPNRTGYRSDGRGFLLTRGVTLRKEDLRLHHTDYYLGMLQRIGLSASRRELSLYCTEEEKDWAKEQLGNGPRVAINPGAAYGSAKRWFPERFAEVANSIRREFGMDILLVGGPAEREIGDDIVSRMPEKPLDMIGRTSVRQMMSLLSQCRLMVTNDSGPMHVAAALGIPVVALFGPTDHTTTSPLSDAVRIVRKDTECAPCLKRVCPTDQRCMTAIDPGDVMVSVRSLLEETGGVAGSRL